MSTESDLRISLQLFKSLDGFVGKLDVPPPKSRPSMARAPGPLVPAIVLLDRSASMGASVQRLVRNVIPEVFSLLGYEPKDPVTLITFDTFCEVHSKSIQALRNSTMTERGSTNMLGAVEALENIVLAQLGSTQIRILAISDGDLHDQEETVLAASKLSSKLSDRLFVSAHCVRYFTSTSEPDTRGLAGILQLNRPYSSARGQLIDIPSAMSDDEAVRRIAKMFEGNGTGAYAKLSCQNPVLRLTPWSPDASISRLLQPGANLIWFTSEPANLQIQIAEEKPELVSVEIVEALSEASYNTLFTSQIEHYVSQAKLLKIVNTTESLDEVERMTTYFKRLESFILSNDIDVVDLLRDSSLRGRLEFFRTVARKREKSLATRMLEVGNDVRVANFNSAQAAAYLRIIDSTSTGKALARRSETFGTDFDNVVRNEVKAMHSNLHSLRDINDENHAKSFFSQNTTVGGIHFACSLVDLGIIDKLDASEVLQILNIVGIACQGPIGDFPDPMTWRAEKIFPGCFVSVSDIIAALQIDPSAPLKPIGIDEQITNVIPVFEDARVERFLRRHAPSILEYTASIGMRRVITGIPMTFAYTLCAGIWKMVEVLNTNRLQVNITCMISMVRSYEIAIGRHFDYVLPFIKKQDETCSYYICNNGLTNMIIIIITLLRRKEVENLKRILRAIYSFEVYQAVGRYFKTHPGTNVSETLAELLSVDFAKHGTKVPALFEPVMTPIHYGGYETNKSVLGKIADCFWYLDFIALIPLIFPHVLLTGKGNSSVNIGQSTSCLRTLPELDENVVKNSLGINYDLETFKLFNVVQAMIYNKKAKRVDEENEKMRFDDLGNKNLGEKMVKEYVRELYKRDYENQLSQKSDKELEHLSKILVKELLYAKTVPEFEFLLIRGIAKGTATLQIKNPRMIGFSDLMNGLLDLSCFVPSRLEKISLLVVGRNTKDEPVFNNGGVLLSMSLGTVKSVFEALNENILWSQLEEAVKSRGHIYRTLGNRHGHSNEKPSYWAMGYSTLEEMISIISLEEWNSYKQLHKDCCGIPRLAAGVSYRQQK